MSDVLKIIVDHQEYVLDKYKSYVALLTQTSTGAPIAVVMNGSDSNYLGAIAWTRTGAGAYSGTLTGVFTASKTLCIVNQTVTGIKNVAINWFSVDVVKITTVDASNVAADGVITSTAIEIRVYQA